MMTVGLRNGGETYGQVVVARSETGHNSRSDSDVR